MGCVVFRLHTHGCVYTYVFVDSNEKFINETFYYNHSHFENRLNRLLRFLRPHIHNVMFNQLEVHVKNT